jgi:hypothetical protein
MSLATAMTLVAGVALGLWIFTSTKRADPHLILPVHPDWRLNDWRTWAVGAYASLLGLAMAGSCVLLVGRFRKRQHWRAGASALFAVGIASWLFTPMAALVRYRGDHDPEWLWTFFCVVLPVVSVFLLAANITGARCYPRWWACEGWWAEWFGMWLLVALSLPGLYCLADVISMYWKLFT